MVTVEKMLAGKSPKLHMTFLFCTRKYLKKVCFQESLDFILQGFSLPDDFMAVKCCFSLVHVGDKWVLTNSTLSYENKKDLPTKRDHC